MDTEKSCFCFAERKKKTLKNIYQSIDRLIDRYVISQLEQHKFDGTQ